MKEEQNELEQKRKEYTEYVEKHRRFVKNAYKNFVKANVSNLTQEKELIELLVFTMY